MNFRIVDGEKVRTTIALKASGTVIAPGDLVALDTGLIVKAGATSGAIALAPKGGANGETQIEVTLGNDFTLEGTADANFAVTQKGTEVDIDAQQQIDVGSSSIKVLKVDVSENAGTVGSADNVRVRIIKPLF